jgi:hypothetical protein
MKGTILRERLRYSGGLDNKEKYNSGYLDVQYMKMGIHERFLERKSL